MRAWLCNKVIKVQNEEVKTKLTPSQVKNLFKLEYFAIEIYTFTFSLGICFTKCSG